MRTTNCNQQFKVRVHCATFNHAQYITDAMNGFVMQKTEFPFICTIFDDCSTDEEKNVIMQYLHENFELEDKNAFRNEEKDDYVLVFARHKTNHNCFFAVYFLKYNHYSINKGFRKDEYCKEFVEYIPYTALCEGDDYWTDPLKLQKQVDCLENHPDCILVYTGFETVDAKGIRIQRPFFDFIKRHSKDGDIFDMQVIRNHVMTVTTCYRKELVNNLLYIYSPYHYDYSLSLCASLVGHVIYLPDNTCCYRKTPGSMIVSKKSKVAKELNEVREYYCVAYLKGKGFRRSFLNDLVIRYKIMRTYLYEKRDLGELLKVKPSLKLLLPIVRMMDKVYR